MEYEVTSYSDLSLAFRKCDKVYHKVRTSPAVKGKRQRAMLRGEYAVYHDVRFDDFTATFVMLMKANRTYYIIHTDDFDGACVIRQTYNTDTQHVYTIIRRHAVERYIQRQVFHDEGRKMTEEEYTKYSRLIANHFLAATFYYDPITRGYIGSYDGGSFIAVALGEKRIAYMLVQTFITASMMKKNQSLANGISRLQSNQLVGTLENPTLQHIARNIQTNI